MFYSRDCGRFRNAKRCTCVLFAHVFTSKCIVTKDCIKFFFQFWQRIDDKRSVGPDSFSIKIISHLFKIKSDNNGMQRSIWPQRLSKSAKTKIYSTMVNNIFYITWLAVVSICVYFRSLSHNRRLLDSTEEKVSLWEDELICCVLAFLLG